MPHENGQSAKLQTSIHLDPKNTGSSIYFQKHDNAPTLCSTDV